MEMKPSPPSLFFHLCISLTLLSNSSTGTTTAGLSSADAGRSTESAPESYVLAAKAPTAMAARTRTGTATAAAEPSHCVDGFGFFLTEREGHCQNDRERGERGREVDGSLLHRRFRSGVEGGEYSYLPPTCLPGRNHQTRAREGHLRSSRRCRRGRSSGGRAGGVIEQKENDVS